MAVETHVEPFDQGLVTARDQAFLQPGELAKADNCVYRPNDPFIQKTKGRTVYNSTPITGSPSVKGLRHLVFDDANPIVVAHHGTSYDYSIMTAETGTFTSLATGVGSGETLDAIQYGNRHYLLNGASDTNYVVKSDYTTRNHGLFAVSDAPTVASTTGSWNSTGLGLGYYFFITTELVNPGSPDEIESTNVADDATIIANPAYFLFNTSNIASASVAVTKPQTFNSSATHWQIYMAGPKEVGTPVPPRSDFRRVGSPVAIATSTVTIGNTQTPGTNNRFPTTNSTVVAGWSNPNNAHLNDNTGTTTNTHLASQLYQTFGFASITGTVTGVQVEIKARVQGTINGKPLLRVRLTKDNGSNYSAYQAKEMALSTTPGTGTFGEILAQALQWNVLQYGGPNDPWGLSWSGSDFNAPSQFGVNIQYYWPNLFGTGSTVNIDYIKVTVHTVGGAATTQIALGNQFPTVILSVGGVMGAIGSHGPPPVATTGDIFEDQMVLNDVADPSIIKYSLPVQVDYFPTLYFINFETKLSDVVTKIVRLGDKLLVGQKNQLFRVNYLPRESDAEFDRGRCYETLSEGQGVVGTQAACTFTVPGGPLMMAFVSYAGVHITDGFQVETLSDDLDWPNTVDIPSAGDSTDYLKNCVLVDYPLNYWLVLYYTPTGGTSNTRALVFHYHPSHRKPGGKFKITGPITVSGLSATVGKLTNCPVLMTGQSSGTVYVEDRGYTHNAGGTLAVDLRTREMYPWGMVNTGTVENFYIKHNQDATSTVTTTLLLREGNNAQTSFAQTETFTTAQAGLYSIPYHVYTDSIQVKFTEPGADGGAGMRLGAMMLDFASRGGAE